MRREDYMVFEQNMENIVESGGNQVVVVSDEEQELTRGEMSEFARRNETLDGTINEVVNDGRLRRQSCSNTDFNINVETDSSLAENFSGPVIGAAGQSYEGNNFVLAETAFSNVTPHQDYQNGDNTINVNMIGVIGDVHEDYNGVVDVNENNDDIEIISERSWPHLRGNVINNRNVEVVDLDNEPEGGSLPGTAPMTVNDNSTGVAAADEDLMILQERITQPRTMLALPGGATIELASSRLDQPVRSSFQWQDDINNRRVLRSSRSSRRGNGQGLFVSENPDEDSSEYSNTSSELNYAHSHQIRSIKGRITSTLFSVRRFRELQRRGLSIWDSRGAMSEIQARIVAFPNAVANAFLNAQSLQEFKNLIQYFNPVVLRHCERALIGLYGEVAAFRSSLHDLPAPMGNNMFVNLRPNSFASNAGSVVNGQREMGFNAWVPQNSNQYSEEFTEEQRTQSIIAMIQEREEEEHDKNVKKYMENTKGLEGEIEKRAADLPKGYSCSFDTAPKVEFKTVQMTDKALMMVIEDDGLNENDWETVPMCVLCGIELGVGIPDEYTGINQEDKGLSFEELVSKYDYTCPYQSLMRPSQSDKDLSKRTFIASCGHTYCGRCYVRIENAKGKSKMSKKKLMEMKGAAHPDNYGPKICPATGCKNYLRTRGKMREAYF